MWFKRLYRGDIIDVRQKEYNLFYDIETPKDNNVSCGGVGGENSMVVKS